MERYFFSSESVTNGHPDKVCDQIADRILDRILEQDPEAHVACEVTCVNNQVHIFGEVTTTAQVDYEAAAREVIREIGYTKPEYGFDADTCEVRVDLHEQSPDIARGVNRRSEAEQLDQGAGDQGIMFGYACNETEDLMPLPIELAHKLAKRLEDVRVSGELSYLRPDGKSQVVVEYEDGTPVRIASVLVSAQHDPDHDIDDIREDILHHVMLPVLPADMLDDETQYFVNPTGRFVIGGPAGDSGLTGRKLIVDTYGGYAHHGGGAFSGKDASKVDRSASYIARYAAKNVVAAGLADRCEIQLSYAIGLADPMSIRIDTFGTEKVPKKQILEKLTGQVDFRPQAIIHRLDLKSPNFSKVACYGHFGSNAADMPWEQTDLNL